MNADMDRYLSPARAHELAGDRAQAPGHGAVVRFWARIDRALARTAGGAERSARRLLARLQRRARTAA